MKQIWSIASRELRGYFNSAIALIFLATFLLGVMFTFFWVDNFFANNTADVAPLFVWLPRLLIFLVAALTMRLWSEEHKSGTIEILLTLPVPIYRLVLGKFIAGIILVAVALALTLGLPITISMMGNLDWGPVIGGYLGALLLASAYLSLGLCVSSLTENQIVALIGTLVLGALLYLPGVEEVANLFGVEESEILRLIGTGSRFESVARGVLDLRDLAYYASLVAFFLALNTTILEARRWSQSRTSDNRRRAQRVGFLLVAVNALALNAWLQPVGAARVDLTEDQRYSLSDTTKAMLAGLDEPLVLRGYFSEKTHPQLVPLVPEIRNMLSEYKIAGEGKVRVEIIDPSNDEDVAARAKSEYNIVARPFRFAGRHEQSIVNAYFHLLVSYGDQHQVLQVNDLIASRQYDIDKIDIYVDNFEYEVTKTIRQLVYDFQSIESVFASLAGDLEMLAFVTPEDLPGQWKAAPEILDSVAEEFTEQSGGKLKYSRTEPKGEEEREALFDTYGIRPFSRSIFKKEHYYMHIVLKLGDDMQAIIPPEEMNEANMREAVRQGIERIIPGFNPVIAIYTPPPIQENPRMVGLAPPPPKPVQTFQAMIQNLAANYDIRNAKLDDGSVPDDIDVLIVAGPDGLTNPALKAIDQFLMRGGSVIVLYGRYRYDRIAPAGVFVTQNVDTRMDDMLARYGITIGEHMIIDEQADVFPNPMGRPPKIRYGLFPRVQRSGLDEGGIITKDLGTVILHWATPIEIAGEAASTADAAGAGGASDAADSGSSANGRQRTVTRLMVSSDNSWVHTDKNIKPQERIYPKTGFARPESATTGPFTLGVALTGTFDSAFSNQTDADSANAGQSGDDTTTGNTTGTNPAGANPDTPNQAPTAAGGQPQAVDILPERLLERSPPDARLIVVGSSSFVADFPIQLANAVGNRDVGNNLKLVQNMIDWAVADTELLAIRSRGSASRSLGDVVEEDRITWEYINYAIALLGLLIVILLAFVQRRAAINAASRIIVPKAAAGSDRKELKSP